MKRNYGLGFFFLMLSLLWGCGSGEVTFADPKLKPFWAAAAAVNRAALGFTTVDPASRIVFEQHNGKNYDVMLHIYARTSRTMAFRKDGAGYRWIHEQEIHTGPRKYTTVDGTLNEEIVITYETESVSGAPNGKTFIQYHGPDAKLAYRTDLVLDDVQAMIDEWDAHTYP